MKMDQPKKTNIIACSIDPGKAILAYVTTLGRIVSSSRTPTMHGGLDWWADHFPPLSPIEQRDDGVSAPLIVCFKEGKNLKWFTATLRTQWQ